MQLTALEFFPRKFVASAPFPSWNRSMLTEIYLYHACSYHEILRMDTARQVPHGEAQVDGDAGHVRGDLACIPRQLRSVKQPAAPAAPLPCPPW
eukprot:COSAG01_NODE_8146_length_2904_cov_10.815686_2_plen_94_part_00